MPILTDVKSRVSSLARAEKERYSGGEERPLGGYLAAILAGADLLQFGYSWLQEQS